MEKYEYRPLNREQKEIRLVRFPNLEDPKLGLAGVLNPDPKEEFTSKNSLTSNEPIYCTIEHHPLDDMRKQYIALSYTWGSRTPRERLVVKASGEDRAVAITENLNSALHHIGFSIPVWIDSVCINQADDEEKSWQVQLMWSIFEKAALVSAWLGPSADDSDRLMDQIRDTYIAAMEACSKLPSEDRALLAAGLDPARAPSAKKIVFFHCGTKEASMAAFHFVLGKLMKIANEFRAKQLSIVTRESFESGLGYFIEHRNTKTIGDILWRHRASRQKLVSFADLMRQIYVHSEGLQASDARDLIFALVGMAGNQGDLKDSLIRIDYRITKEQAYFCTAFELIDHIGPEVLTWSNCNGRPKEEDKLPSWAPDWSKRILWPLGDFGNTKALRFKASRGSKCEIRFKRIDTNDEYPYLVVTGITVDTVAQVGGAMEFEMPDLFDDTLDPDLALQSGWLADLERLSKHCHRSTHYPTLSALQEALWKTPIADLIVAETDQILSTPDMEEGYKLVRKKYVRPTMKAAKFYGMTAVEKEEFRLTARYWNSMNLRSNGRRYFCCESALLGLGPDGVREGDVVVIIFGMGTLMVLRREEPKEQGGAKETWTIVGEAYIDGVMDGELVDKSEGREFWIC